MSAVLEVQEELFDSILLDAISSGGEVCRQGFADGMRPDPVFTVDSWADARRMLSLKGSAEAGRYRTSRTPYAKMIMQCLSPSDPCTEVIWMKGAQIGATEVGNNWFGAIMDAWPGPCLFVQPTLDMAKRNSRQRIAPMIDACPTLREKIRPSRERDSGNTLLMKEFTNGMLAMIGANSSASVRSYTARCVMTDEEDEYPAVLAEQGDPIELVIARMRTYKHGRKHFRPSTPTVEGLSRIEPAFRRGTMRYYYLQCWSCGLWQQLEWGSRDSDGGVKWKSTKLAREAYYQCKQCKAKWEEWQKIKLLDGGEWKATNPEPEYGVESFHLSALYSPWFTWGEAARMWLRSQGPQNHSKLRVFQNTVLGLVWKDLGTGPPWEKLVGLTETYPMIPGTKERLVPGGVGIIVCGVDIQGDRWEAQVVGFGAGHEFWVLRYQVFYGDPTGDVFWKELFKFINQPMKMERGGVDYIRSTVVDSGFLGQQVYAFCGEHAAYHTQDGDVAYTWAVKGTPGAGQLWPSQPSEKKIFENVPLWPIKVDGAKEWLYGRAKARLKKDCEPGPMYIHWTDEFCDEDYFRQFASEHCKIETSTHNYPVRVWELRPGFVRNEALDTIVYAYAAIEAVIRQGLNLNDETGRRQQMVIQPPPGVEAMGPHPSQGRPSMVKGPEEVARPPTPDQQRNDGLPDGLGY